MITATGYVRDYDPTTDTATVEIVGAGIIDVWITGMRIHSALTRGQLAGGVPVTVEMPDMHRICEAVISNQVDTAAADTARLETGRVQLTLGGTGIGSATVTFPTPFTTTPRVTAAVDGRIIPVLSAVSTTGFTVGVTVPSLPNGLVWVTWSAFSPSG